MIVGVGRSGTTLLRLMLDAHPELAIPAETAFLPPLLGRVPITRQEFFHAVTGFPTWPDLAMSEADLDAELRRCEPFSLAEGTRSFYRLYAAARGKARWGDKTPSYGQHVPAIAELLPEARFVHIVRDGRDVALSLRATWFAPGQDMTTLATHWREQVRATRRDGAASGRVLEVRYEDLVAFPEAVLRGVCDHVELHFDQAMLSYHRSARERLQEVQDRLLDDGVTLISQERRLHNHRFTSLPPQPERVGRWRRELDSREVDAFASVAGDLLEELGYPV